MSGLDKLIDKIDRLVDEIDRLGECEKVLAERDIRIQGLEEENKRLNAVHNSELGVCEQHCDIVTRLHKALEEIERYTRTICYTTDYEGINQLATEALKEGEDDAV